MKTNDQILNDNNLDVAQLREFQPMVYAYIIQSMDSARIDGVYKNDIEISFNGSINNNVKMISNNLVKHVGIYYPTDDLIEALKLVLLKIKQRKIDNKPIKEFETNGI